MKENDTSVVPRHVGYIIDGNRRWARQHGLPTYEGHLAGYDALKQVLFESFEAGIQYVSVYAFSTENWKRDSGEVGKLMKLAMRVLGADLGEFIKRGIQIKVLGVADGLNDKLVETARNAEAKTAHLSRGTLCICFNYGGQREIIDAARSIVAAGLTPAEIDEKVFEKHLYAPDIPTVDVIVRTSGEQRLSNFMLWRAAYSEFIFLEKLWPDMRTDDVHAIIAEYQKRERRLGS